MRVADLIDQLKKHDPNLHVYLASDPEGNSFCRIEKDCVNTGYVETLNYFVDNIKHFKKWNDDLQEQGYCREDLAGENDVKVLVIYPG